MNYEELKEYDKNKTKVLKYVIYKKRTENEIRKKFENEINDIILEDIINELKENKYISDIQYVKKSVNEYIALKNISKKQIKYKLLSKGIELNLIEEYFYEHNQELNDYEVKAAYYLINKNNKEPEEIIQTLLKKGFEYDNLKQALEKEE